MSLASSSAVQIGYIPEATFGVTPVSGNYRYLRVTGESLDFAITKEASKEINSTRTISSMSPTGASASGGTQSEMQYAELDTLMAATLQSAYTVYGTNGVGTTFTATFTTTTITASAAPTGSSAFTGLQLGQWFSIGGSVNNTNKLLRVSTSVAPTATVITLDANTPAVAEASVAGVAVRTARLTHGTTQTSFSIERQSPDISQYFRYRGMTPSKMDLSLSYGALTSCNFDFMGKDVVRGSVTGLPGTPVASYTYDVMSGVSNTANCQVWVGNTPLTGTFAKSISLSFDNALRAQDALCTLGSVGVGSGTINCTVNASIYFNNGTLFDAFLANTNNQIIFSSVDTAGNGYVFTLPVANISSYKVAAGSKDQDMMIDMQLTCLRDNLNATPALQKVVFIDRFGVAVV
jgi:Phage tail tube protein